MTDPIVSGIYRITFPSGKTYIGKSIDYYTRIKQHYDKFKKGTAAKPMQEQYNKYKSFKAEVIFECHPDHIDLMESLYIAREIPDLNTTRPSDPFPGVYGDDLEAITDKFDISTYEHVKIINNISSSNQKLQKNIQEYKSYVVELEKERTEEELATEVGEKLQDAIEQNEDYVRLINERNNAINNLKQRIQYLEQPWWKKFF